MRSNTIFSDVLLAAGNAVEGRRRRSRIERLLGSLLEPPEKVPSPSEADPQPDLDAKAAGVAVNVIVLHEKQIATENARAALVAARQEEKADHRKKPPADKQQLAADYLKAAKDWHEGAVAYRDEQLPTTRDTTARTPER